MHTYPEYALDVDAAFGAVASQHGLTRTARGNMPAWAHPAIEIWFGIDASQPEVWMQLPNRPLLSLAQYLAASGRAYVEIVPPIRAFTSREHAQHALQCVARFLDGELTQIRNAIAST